MRVGDRTDFNKLVFDIETDGSIRPESAFKKAIDILDEHIKIIDEIEISEEIEEEKKPSKSKSKFDINLNTTNQHCSPKEQIKSTNQSKL